jgi:hypothetical protein
LFSLGSVPVMTHTTVEESETTFSLWSVSGLYISDVDSHDRTVPAVSYQLVSDGKGRHKSWLQKWLQSWSRGLQKKRKDSAAVSYKVNTL